MPIEIKELIVRIVVQDTGKHPIEAPRPDVDTLLQILADECVERVMEKLEAKTER